MLPSALSRESRAAVSEFEAPAPGCRCIWSRMLEPTFAAAASLHRPPLQSTQVMEQLFNVQRDQQQSPPSLYVPFSPGYGPPLVVVQAPPGVTEFGGAARVALPIAEGNPSASSRAIRESFGDCMCRPPSLSAKAWAEWANGANEPERHPVFPKPQPCDRPPRRPAHSR